MRNCLHTLPGRVLKAPSGLASLALIAQTVLGASFTRLEPLAPPRIVSSAEAYPGGQHEPGNLLDGKSSTDYSANGKGTNTFVEFDFGAPVRIRAFRHIDRNDPATLTASELTFSDSDGKVVAVVPISHPNQRSGVTFLVLPSEV